MIEHTDDLKERFLKLMNGTGRKNISSYLKWLEDSTDFYQAPASTKYHLSTPSGLLLHSLNVYDALMDMLEKVPADEAGEKTEECFRYSVNGITVGQWKHSSLVICALNHDICKVNFYGKERKNRKVYSEKGSKKDSEGFYDWESYMAYVVNDTMPYGHGEKSVMLLQSFIPLTLEERFAIRWHMGAFGIQGNDIHTYREACMKYPLVYLIHQADQIASLYMEEEENNKENFIIH